MSNSPPPSVTPPPLGVGDNSSSGGGRGAPLSPTSIGHSVVGSGNGAGGADSQVLQHGRGGGGGGSSSSSSAAFGGSGRDYTFSHLHAQSGQVFKTAN